MNDPRIPLLFFRRVVCTAENGLKVNSCDGRTRMTAVVMLPTINDEKFYNSKWMGGDRHAIGQSANDDNDYVTVPDVDIVADEDIYTFDSDDAEKNYLDALRKMRELWMEMEVSAT